jgi:hypothetical protein
VQPQKGMSEETMKAKDIFHQNHDGALRNENTA